MLTELCVEVAAATRVGLRRKTNADAYLVDEASGVLAVADGMGDSPRSTAVAKMALDAVRELFLDPWLGRPLAERTIGEASERLLHGIMQAHSRLHVPAAPGGARQGTTFVGAVLTARHFCVASVGDSRAYVLRAGADHLVKLTEDDTVLGEALRTGIPYASAMAARDAHALTRAIGVRAGVEALPIMHRYSPGDLLLLCSDGVTDRLRADQLAEHLFGERDLERAAHRILERVQAARGADDATVVLARRGGRARGMGDDAALLSDSGVRRIGSRERDLRSPARLNPDRDRGQDERWRRLAAGHLSPTEHDALREEAMKTDEGRALYELYRPLDDGERERLYHAVLGARTKGPRGHHVR